MATTTSKTRRNSRPTMVVTTTRVVREVELSQEGEHDARIIALGALLDDTADRSGTEEGTMSYEFTVPAEYYGGPNDLKYQIDMEVTAVPRED